MRPAVVTAAAALALAASACPDRSSGTGSGSSRPKAITPASAGAGSATRRPAKRAKKPVHVRDLSARQQLAMRIAFFEKRIKAMPRQHLFFGLLAGLYQRKAALDAELWPHGRAIALCRRAIKMGGDKARLSLTLARSLVALHKLPEARTAIAAARAKVAAAKLLPLEAELALQVGDYKTARAKLAALAKTSPANSAGLLGVLEHTLGSYDEARAHFERALGAADTKRARAWVRVMRGISSMQRGRFAEAKADFKAAVRLAPGYILAAEHLAEIQFRLGKLDQSIALYEGVLSLTKNPEFHAAIAEVHRKKGQTAAAVRHEHIAAKRYARWLARFPEAAWGHAVDFYLGAGKDPKKAAALARKNAALRPSGPALLMLAEALFAAGNHAAALTAITQALAKPARSADLYWTASRIFAKSNPARARALKAKALRMNPKQAEM